MAPAIRDRTLLSLAREFGNLKSTISNLLYGKTKF